MSDFIELADSYLQVLNSNTSNYPYEESMKNLFHEKYINAHLAIDFLRSNPPVDEH